MGLDGIEIVMAWEEAFGVSIVDAEAATLRTPRMAVDLICRKMDVREENGFCFSQRIFHRLRKAFVTVLGCPRAAITPRTRLGELIPFRGRRQICTALARETGLPFPDLTLGVGSWSLPVGDFVLEMTAYSARAWLGTNLRWSRCRVREVVRAVVTRQTGIRKFSDDADFVYDLRID